MLANRFGANSAANDDFALAAIGGIYPITSRALSPAKYHSALNGDPNLDMLSTFNDIAQQALAREVQKYIAGDITKQTLGMFKSRLQARTTQLAYVTLSNLTLA